MLLVNDDAVEEQVKAELESKTVGESTELKDELEKCKTKLEESRKLGKMFSDKCKEYERK